MALLERIKFAVVRTVSNACRPLLRVTDPRTDPGIPRQELLPARTVRWSRAHFTLHGAPPFWAAFREVRLDAAWAMELRDALVVGKGLVVDQQGRVVLESALFQEEYLRRTYQNHWVLLRHHWPASHHAYALPLINYLDGNYFHWMLEAMGRLELVADRLGDASLKLLVDADAPPFVKASIAFLHGVPAERIVADGTRTRRVDRCLLVSNPHTRNAATGRANVYDPTLIRAINRRALERLGPVSGAPVDLLITRRHGSQRRIVNEQALLQRFPQLQAVALEELSFAEQVALFARARTVVAVHGAGLTNLLFARNARVIELYPQVREEKDSSYFFQLSDALGLQHDLFACEPVNAQQDVALDDGMFGAIAEALLRP